MTDIRAVLNPRSSTRNKAKCRAVLIVLWFLILGLARGFAEEAYSMKPVRPQASADFPQSMVSTLDPHGFAVYGEIGGEHTLICEIFWARRVAAGDAAPAASKLFYSRLRAGTLVGVIHFLIIERYVREYRSQTIRPGYYTMRYAAQPEGSNGSALDFVLLSPLSADRNPDQVPSLDELRRRALLASRVKRPLMMSLTEVDTDQPFPGLITDDEGTCVLQVKLPLKNGKAAKADAGRRLAIALVVITAIPADLGD